MREISVTYIEKNGYWWASTPAGDKKAICRQMSYTDTFVMRKILHKKQGFSVRCVKD